LEKRDEPAWHTFLVPAYGQSPHLEACLQSLKNQVLRTSVVVSTSTPFKGMEDLVERYGAQLLIHGPNQGMSHDWNQGLRQVQSPWVTIAHQDDMYDACFTAELHKALEQARGELNLVFTNYAECIEEQVRPINTLLKIKKLLLELGFLGRNQVYSRWAKKNCLRFGSPIPCPSVSLNLHLHPIVFDDHYRVNMDWAAWLERANQKGGFYWIRQTLMHHRLHKSSETTIGLEQGHRATEDLALLNKLWPAPLAKLIHYFYFVAYKSNQGL